MRFTLEPGGNMFSGTPGGSGWKVDTFMKPGRKIDAPEML